MYIVAWARGADGSVARPVCPQNQMATKLKTIAAVNNHITIRGDVNAIIQQMGQFLLC